MVFARFIGVGMVLAGCFAAFWILAWDRPRLGKEADAVFAGLGPRVAQRWRRVRDVAFVLGALGMIALVGFAVFIALHWPVGDVAPTIWLGCLGVMLPVGVWSWLGRMRRDMRYQDARIRARRAR